MRIVEMTDVNQVIDEYVDELKNDPTRKHNTYACHLADFCIETLERLRNDISTKSRDRR